MLNHLRRQEIIEVALTALLDPDRLKAANESMELSDAEYQKEEHDRKKYGGLLRCRGRVTSFIEPYDVEYLLAELPGDLNGVVVKPGKK